MNIDLFIVVISPPYQRHNGPVNTLLQELLISSVSLHTHAIKGNDTETAVWSCTQTAPLV